jgi:hypothetical protein
MRAEAQAEQLHLAGVTDAGVIIMSVLLGAVVVILALVLKAMRDIQAARSTCARESLASSGRPSS